VTDLLRGTVGFDGVVITDDLSGAAQVTSWSPGDRAVLSLEAGVDLVLFSKDPSVAPAAVEAVVSRAESDPAFAVRVDESLRRVLALKEKLGLV
jgi:beta-N-acetylhexosaminidase